MSNDLKVINNLPTSKAEQVSVAKAIIRQVVDGNVDPIQVHVQIATMEGLLKLVKGSEDYQRTIVDYAERQGKSFSAFGANIQVKEAGVKYDYSACNDPVWTRLSADFEQSKQSLKEREDFLKFIPLRGQTIVDDETGECSLVYPPVRLSTTGVTVTIK